MVANFVMGRLTEASVLLRTLRAGMASPVFSLPAGCGGNSRIGTPILSTSLFASLRANRLEAHVHRHLDFSGIYGTFSLTASKQFPRFPSPGRFARTQISCSPPEHVKPAQSG